MLYLYEKRVLDELVKRLRRIEGVQKVVLFGSLARGEHRPDSDVDVAVFLGAGGERFAESVKEVADEIYAEFGVPITVVVIHNDRDNVPGTMVPLIEEIERHGVVLWRRRSG